MKNINLRDLVQKLAQFVTITLSQESKLNEIFDLIPDEEISKLIKNSPTWFQHYGFSHQQMVLQMIESNEQMKADFENIKGQSSPLNFILEDTEKNLSSNAKDMNKLMQGKGALTVQFEEASHSQEVLISLLAQNRALLATIRSQCVYGQSMNTLLQAGINGNDEGFLRVAAIDPTILAHRAIVDRISRANVAKRDNFFLKLQKASINGVSKKIGKDHNQLRYVLGLLYEEGALQQMSSEQRYQWFCVDLDLYPITGKDPEAGLRIFIDRWQQNLVF